ncbi:Pre-mRNA-splicing factor SYF2 [Marasmius sp. AFHP31]|nr:Pre-mRNA-splicing factor SYF2 [Marasmius sp. AFHP31]
MPPTRSSKRSKKAQDDSKASEVEDTIQQDQESTPVEHENGDAQTAHDEDQMTGVEQDEEAETSEEKPEGSKITMEDRRAKLEQLKKKMALSSRANRQSLIEESAKAKITARDAARLERQRKLAEMLRTKADAEERGEDVERAKNWEYTIEDNDNWEKKLARKARRADFEFHDDAHAAHRKYKKELDLIKPDLLAYQEQKDLALGRGPGTLTNFEAGSSSQVIPTSHDQQLAAENLYRDANTLIYGDNKPSEEAIDRVVSKINRDLDKRGKFSRKRLNEEEGDITYINEHNRVFNKKIARYYDKYTAEIRASFERGTAL